MVWGPLKVRLPHGRNVLARRQQSVGETAITKSGCRESHPGPRIIALDFLDALHSESNIPLGTRALSVFKPNGRMNKSVLRPLSLSRLQNCRTSGCLWRGVCGSWWSKTGVRLREVRRGISLPSIKPKFLVIRNREMNRGQAVST